MPTPDNRSGPIRRLQRAFTLLELLVSVTILAAMLAMVGTLMSEFSRTLSAGSSGMQTYEDVRNALSILSRELSSAVVRTQPGRSLTFRVDAPGATDRRIFFCSTEESLQSLTNMSFVTHYAYFWNGGSNNSLYRAEQSSYSDNAALLGTESSTNNSDHAANRARLGAMTLSYGTGPGWYSAPLMVNAMQAATNAPILEHVFDFNVICTSRNNTLSTNDWTDATQSPTMVTLQMRVADRRQAATILRGSQPASDPRLRTFRISVPLVGSGANSPKLTEVLK